ncbi:Protein ADP-ribosyltransferase [bioreactor metagenome]|uniref:Protein ADP-ribosyltransferase n=1 Tax=bioreactor metagenome TaxID=1076179 RepID=A0A645ALN9_9ZZZZ
MQGNYDSLQCMAPCSDEIYASEEYVKKMVESISNNQVSIDSIPRCPHCGNYLIPNLRCDDTFVEKPHMKNEEKYRDFLRKNIDKNILFLELGVGYNTPVIIRYPFEQMTYNLNNATLVRVNKGMVSVSKEIEDKSILIDEDINKVLQDVIENMN